VSKYRSQVTNGFASKREASVAATLQALEKVGKITELKFQVPFELIPKIGKQRSCSYIADFTWMEGGLLHVGDAKGFRTPVYELKKKLMKWIYDYDIEEL
jgi:hypothetical protein